MQTNRYVAVGLAVVLCLSLAGCTDDFGGGSEDSYGIGETAELGQENTTIAVTVDDFRFAESYDAADGSGGTQTVTAPNGEQFLFVKVTVENVGNEDGATPAVSMRPRNTTASDPQGAPTWASDGLYRSIRPLPTGESRTGWVRATVADNVTDADVEVAFSTDILVTSGEYKWLLVPNDDEE
ncbi:hypothetical protein [Haloarchaeobius baliensis]|uniref:hypothetical protein n=1 Tax=Haloarchaeobius baliensis TaxID=1670458 RepID=UPI003F885381